MLEGSSASPDLARGTTSANFQTCANVCEEKEVSTRFVIAESVVGKLSFSTLAVTLSKPRALFDGKDLTIFPTSSSVTEIQIVGTGRLEGCQLLDNSLILDLRGESCVLQ